MELFKERKKQRKKKAAAKVVNESADSNFDGSHFVNQSELTTNHDIVIQNDVLDTQSKRNTTNGEDQIVENQMNTETIAQERPPISQQPKTETASARFQRKRKERKSRSQSSESLNLVASHSECNQEISAKKMEKKALHILEEAIYRLSLLEEEDNYEGAVGLRDQIQKLASTYSPVYNEIDNSSTNSSTSQLQSHTQSVQTPRHILLPDERCFTIPDHDRPIDPKSSLAIAAARVFVDLYYLHISHRLTSDLVHYYTSHAQKSVSVGGAHSVVGSREDIALQLSSLSGSNFIVRGVVSQDSYDNKGAHILVTGVVHTTAGILTPFAHSISLVPVRGEYEFQIHNDALSLMTPSDDWDRTSRQPLPGVPPPGLGF